MRDDLILGAGVLLLLADSFFAWRRPVEGLSSRGRAGANTARWLEPGIAVLFTIALITRLVRGS
jgi:hypothetical protein